MLPASILRNLTDEEMEAYRAPFREPGEGRLAVLSWPRQLPIDNHPAEVCDLVTAYGAFMRISPMPKLFISADPGMIMNGAAGEFARSWPNQSEVRVKGLHFIQEDYPDEIAAAIRSWLGTF